MGQVDLAEEKSAGIVVDERQLSASGARQWRGAFLHRLVFDADPEPASDWINLGRGGAYVPRRHTRTV